MSKRTQWKVTKPRTSYASGKLMYRVEGPEVVTDYEDWGFTEESARLIAAAPDLLEALLELLASDHANSFEIVGRDTDGHPLNAAGVARKKARAAIAKATGEKE